jgi:uncharacterized protein (TIGR03083 family)
MRVPEALDALRVECELVSEAVLSLPEGEFGRATRCPDWNVMELLAHMYRDVERIIVGLSKDPPYETDADAITYWTSYDPAADAADIADRAKARAASYGSPGDLAIVWDDMWRRAVDLAQDEPPIRIIATWGPALTLEEFLKTRALEITVHGIDMALALGRDPWTTEEGADVTIRVLRGILGSEPPPELEWDELTFIDKGTGRSALTADERAALGELADRFPLLA